MPSFPMQQLFYALLLFMIITTPGKGQSCGLRSIQVSQRTTGARQGMDFEFEVEIKNVCRCAQRNVRINAPGFASQRPVDPTLLRRDGGAFLVFAGNSVPAGGTIKFRYWWDHATYFSPAGSLPAC